MAKNHRRGPKDKKGKSVQEKVDKVMSEFKDGKLKSSDGEKVTKHEQAIAIALSMANEKETADAS